MPWKPSGVWNIARCRQVASIASPMYSPPWPASSYVFVERDVFVTSCVGSPASHAPFSKSGGCCSGSGG